MNDVKITVEVDRESELTFYRFESPTFVYETCLSDGQQTALEEHFRARFVAERVPEDWSNGESFIMHARVPEDVQVLVDEARDYADYVETLTGDPDDTPDPSIVVIRELIDALVSVSSGRDALAAVIEEARSVLSALEPDVEELYDVLREVPSEVLSERDAKVRAEVIDWIEGDNRGLVNRAVSAAREHFGLTKGADRG